MKRAHILRLLFLGVWLAVFMAGYLASRASVFATPQSNCASCTLCVTMEAYWNSSLNVNTGFVVDVANTPAQSAVFGPDIVPGSLTLYSSSTCYNESYSTFTPLEAVNWDTVSAACIIITLPPPPGRYDATSGVGIHHTGQTFDQVICDSH